MDDGVSRLDGELAALLRTVAARTYRPSGPLAFDDLLQIAWLAAIEALDSHDGRARGSLSYIARAVRWRLLDAYRHESHEPRVARSEAELHELTSALDRPDFSDRVVRRIDLARAMRQLRPAHRRAVFELQVLDRPFREVAEERGMTLSALKSLHHRALEHLRKIEEEAA
jgi:RNA polymerase sigma factor (sigma-70 family)